MKLNYDSNGLNFQSVDLQEALLKSECFQVENILDPLLAWHKLVKESDQNITELYAIQKLHLWGIPISEGIERARQVLDFRRKQYQWDIRPIKEIKLTDKYHRAVELVKSQFGRPLKDGSSLFDYQIETAAAMIAKGRILNSLDMGLGSVLCSVTN